MTTNGVPGSNPMAGLIAKLRVAQKGLMKARETLEEIRRLGVDAEQEVVARRNIVHALKDEIAALAGKEDT